MTTRKGDGRKGAQKYQNSRAYKPDRYGESRRMKLAAALPLAGICGRCKEKIEWKKKFNKYKPLAAPKKCVVCQEKKIKQAYYRVCQECAESSGVCAKCGEKEEIVERSFPLSAKEQAKEEAEFRQGLKFMTERERRKLLREQVKHSEKKVEHASDPQVAGVKTQRLNPLDQQAIKKHFHQN